MVKKLGIESVLKSYEPALGRTGVSISKGNFLKELVSEVNKYQKEATESVEKFVTGGSIGIHDVMIALEKADLSLQFLVQLRNKLLEAYQEIMRMQL